MRWNYLLFGLFIFMFLPARAGHSPPKVVLRVHVQTVGEGLSAQQATTITIPPDNEQIQVRTLPEATENEIVDVRQDASGVHLQFNHVGQVNLSAVTAQNQGRILVVLIDGYVVYAPIIDEQITNGELDIPSAHPIPAQIIQLLQVVAQHNVRQAAKS
jgi:preprotein translocase subunit SecD